MLRYRLVGAFILAYTFISSQPASASPITLNYVGYWGYYNPIPIGYADIVVQTGYAAYGIYQDTPVSFSMTINPNSTALPVGSGYFLYPEGLVGGALRVGGLTYTLLPGGLSVDWKRDFIYGANVVGPSVTGSNGFTLTMQALQFNQVNNPMYLGNVTIWQQVFMFMDFGTSEPPVFAGLTLESVSVPEASSLVAVTGALLTLVAIQIRRRKRF
jgi:hypothetical protein